MKPNPRDPFPRHPWVLSKQYGMTLILSQDNEMVLGATACQRLGDELCQYIIDSVNARDARKHPP